MPKSQSRPSLRTPRRRFGTAFTRLAGTDQFCNRRPVHLALTVRQSLSKHAPKYATERQVQIDAVGGVERKPQILEAQAGGESCRLVLTRRDEVSVAGVDRPGEDRRGQQFYELASVHA